MSGDRVNLECDLLGKYIERLLEARLTASETMNPIMPRSSSLLLHGSRRVSPSFPFRRRSRVALLGGMALTCAAGAKAQTPLPKAAETVKPLALQPLPSTVAPAVRPAPGLLPTSARHAVQAGLLYRRRLPFGRAADAQRCDRDRRRAELARRLA